LSIQSAVRAVGMCGDFVAAHRLFSLTRRMLVDSRTAYSAGLQRQPCCSISLAQDAWGQGAWRVAHPRLSLCRQPRHDPDHISSIIAPLCPHRHPFWVRDVNVCIVYVSRVLVAFALWVAVAVLPVTISFVPSCGAATSTVSGASLWMLR
jgi:hypothetical protein